MTQPERDTTTTDDQERWRVTAALECPACGSRELAALTQEVRQQHTGGLVEYADGRIDGHDWGGYLTDGEPVTVGVACRECLWWHEDPNDPYGPLTRATVTAPAQDSAAIDPEGK